MENQKEKDNFHFTYSAEEQEEIKKILQKYQPQEETKMEQLRRLDNEVGKKAATASLSVGIIGALLLGIGMSFTMTDIGEKLGIVAEISMTIGIIVGVVGILLICLAYPIYNHVTKIEREKIAPEILRLTKELMK